MQTTYNKPVDISDLISEERALEAIRTLGIEPVQKIPRELELVYVIPDNIKSKFSTLPPTFVRMRLHYDGPVVEPKKKGIIGTADWEVFAYPDIRYYFYLNEGLTLQFNPNLFGLRRYYVQRDNLFLAPEEFRD